MVGVIAKKVGATVLFSDNGVAEHVTLLYIDSCVVVAHKVAERDGYNAVVVGAGVARKVKKPQAGLFAKAGLEFRKHLREFRVENLDALNVGNCDFKVGAVLDASLFQLRQSIDVVGTSKGKGFAGVIKKYHFAGLEASHGNSLTERSLGSTGQRTYPSKVFKGKRMPGRMGGKRVTVKNLKVLYINDNVIGVRGAVPGAIGNYVLVKIRMG